MDNQRNDTPLPVVTTILVCLFCTQAWAAGIYKWVDEKGDVHYSDKPEHTKSEVIRVEPAPAPDPAALKQRRRRDKLLRVYAEERDEKKKIAAAERAAADKRKRNCETARKRQTDYDNAGYIYDVDADGNRRILTDNEHTAARQQTREDVAEWCG